MKEHRTLNDLVRAVFAITPVSIMFDVIGCISFFALSARQHAGG